MENMENYELEMDAEAVAERLVALLQEKECTIATAESCTGGLICAALVGVPGASRVLNEGYITYSNEAKTRLLSVDEETIESFGVVSDVVALDMALGAAKLAGADCAIGVTGIAGPDGGSEEKPVGTVFAGFYCMGETLTREYHFQGDRMEVRCQTTEAVLAEMLNLLDKTAGA